MTTKGVKGSGLAWFVRRGGAVRGPFSSAKVRHYVLEGRLGIEDEVSGDRVDWRPLGSVDEVVPLQMRTADDGLGAAHRAQQRRERRRAIRTLLVVTGLAMLLVVGVLLSGGDRDDGMRDCAVAPAASVLLEGCDLSRAKWEGAKLSAARLANSRLTAASLSTADLSHADLRYADLSVADLSYADLQSAVLLGATLRYADLTNADLSNADLSFADLSGAKLGGARLEGTKLNGAIWADGLRCGDSVCTR